MSKFPAFLRSVATKNPFHKKRVRILRCAQNDIAVFQAFAVIAGSEATKNSF